ncbi:MAG TPA: Rne/Rng family ribonuclease [Rhizomicrobium sp.]|nr:Rne/Rng family ribonuclease [Rhizomicrobium sp.]
MPKRMLIDSSHPEETRVVVLDGQKVEEFDFEAAAKRPLKGNIYLAKVTRVEPSLQAAFVEYGGNRQGFLAFSEIHPDYYQIPVADRIALLAEQEAEARRRADDDVESFDISPAANAKAHAEFDNGLSESSDDEHSLEADEEVETHSDAEVDHAAEDDDAAEPVSEESEPGLENGGEPASGRETSTQAASESHANIEAPATTAEAATHDASSVQQDAPREAAQATKTQRPPQRWVRRRHYKIQEVIKRRQIILVQVVKEERGNKGAALTTYLSLAGRYCVLMPNTPRGGGISRKITNANDRKRLKSAAQALELPEGMGLIIRTAGENRTKLEIKRDYEYLLRMWDTIRELTLKSNAPACVYEEGDLIKRAIRDLYNKDVEEILVEGDDGYRNAKEFMRMLMPSHAKNVKQYKEPVPLFQRHHIEAQLDSMFSPTVTLKSGGYIVINQTEALVSIDVNSGRATREHSIEETARKTNLEAADEIGRQLRLRDLAGLIVIDFIDMEDSRNDRDVERRIREAVKTDRARVQIGKISQFGLLEMSRQRLRAGVIAGSTVPCPHCGGQGIVRSVESTALRLLRGLEEEGQKLKASAVTVRVAADVAIYALNQKRRELARIENDYGMTIVFEPKEGLMAGTFEIDRTTPKTAEDRARFAVAEGETSPQPATAPSPADVASESEDADETDEVETVESVEEARPSGGGQPQPGSSSKRRRRRGGRGRGGSDRPSHPQARQPSPQTQPERREPSSAGEPATVAEAGIPQASAAQQSVQAQGAGQGVPGQPGAPRKRRRRRGRRGGANRSAADAGGASSQTRAGVALPVANEADAEIARAPSMIREPAVTPAAAPNAASTPVWSFQPEPAEPEPSRESRAPAESVNLPRQSAEHERAEPQAPSQTPEPPKKGWWQRTFRSDH